MFSILMYTGLGCIVTGTIGIMGALSKNQLVPKKNKNDKTKDLTPAKLYENKDKKMIIDAEYSVMPVEDVKEDKSDLEKKYIELLLQNEIIKAELNKKKEVEKKDVEEKKSKYSNLAAEIFKDDEM